MPAKKPKQPKDLVQVSAWIPREHLPLLKAIGGPSESLRDQIEKKAGDEVRLLKGLAECQKLRVKLDEREKALQEALTLLRRNNGNGNSGSESNNAGKRRRKSSD
ncbi:MAG: hypothetical protein PHH85_02195 [Candidatus Methanoperedens sp.]|nr:hypothetical protein [Candidatus Methanoperedens sp.]